WVPPQPESFVPIKVTELGADFPGGAQSGIRWNHAGAIEYEFLFYQGFNHLPSFDAVASQLNLNPPLLEVDIQRFYPKLLMEGGDIAIPTPLFTVKAEAAHFSSSDDRADEYGLYVI